MRKYCLRYHGYLTLEEVGLNNAFALLLSNGQGIAGNTDNNEQNEDSAELEERYEG